MNKFLPVSGIIDVRNSSGLRALSVTLSGVIGPTLNVVLRATIVISIVLKHLNYLRHTIAVPVLLIQTSKVLYLIS